jgi:hypothetical protein
MAVLANHLLPLVSRDLLTAPVEENDTAVTVVSDDPFGKSLQDSLQLLFL